MSALTYHNDPALKAAFLEQITAHEQADRIIQGEYWDGFKGCAVGCSVESLNHINGTTYKHGDHAAYAEALGIPEWLARLEDTLFEGLPVAVAKGWPRRFAEAIPVGVDLEPVRHRFAVFLMDHNTTTVAALDIDESQRARVLAAIAQTKAVHADALVTGAWDRAAAGIAYSAACWSADSAAYSAGHSAALRSAAYSAAYSAAHSAHSAAYSAYWSADSAADSAGCERDADQLIDLLKAVQ